MKLKLIQAKLRGISEIFRCFGNPLLVILFRFGLIKLPFFPYRVHANNRSYSILARPAASDCSDLFVLREVLVEQTYADILPHLPSGSISFVDVGGNLGCFSIWMCGQRDVKRAILFEPEPVSAQLCRFNLFTNQCQRVEFNQKALGGSARHVRMRINPGRPGSNNIYSSQTADASALEPEVEVMAFNAWAEGLPGVVDLIKIDCEGAEWEILRETTAGVWSKFRVAVVEVHRDPANQSKIGEFKGLMEAKGFRTVRWDNVGDGLYVGVRND